MDKGGRGGEGEREGEEVGVGDGARMGCCGDDDDDDGKDEVDVGDGRSITVRIFLPCVLLLLSVSFFVSLPGSAVMDEAETSAA